MRIPVALLFLFVSVSLCSAGTENQDNPDKRPTKDFRGHRDAVVCLDFSPDGRLLVSGSTDGTVKLWDVEGARKIRDYYPRGKVIDARITTEIVSRNIECVAFSPDGKSIIEATLEPSQDAVVRSWDPESGDDSRVLVSGQFGIRCFVYTHDGKHILTSERDPAKWKHSIVMRDAETGKVTRKIAEENIAATNMAISPDGKLLALAGASKIHILDLESGKLLKGDLSHKKAIRSVAFSPNGKLLVSGSADDTIRIWRVKSGELDREIECEQDGVYAACFSPSGKAVVSAGANNTIKVWKPKSGVLHARYWGHLDRVLCLAFSPDGKILASGSRDSVIALWDFDDPEEEDVKDAELDWRD